MKFAHLSLIHRVTAERLDESAQAALEALIETEWGHYFESIGVAKVVDAADVMIRGNLDLETISLVIRHAANGMRFAIEKHSSGGQTGRPPVVQNWFTEPMDQDLLSYASELGNSFDDAVEAFMEQYASELESFPINGSILSKERAPKQGEKRKGVHGTDTRIGDLKESVRASIRRRLTYLRDEQRKEEVEYMAIQDEFEEESK